MTPPATTAILRQFNVWRRGADVTQPKPREIGKAIDAAIEMIDRLESAESGATEQARLNGVGASREAALMAKLEAAEKERTIDEQRIADLMAELNRVGQENEELRAKIAEMERQEPVTLDHLACVDNGVLRFMTGRKAPAHDCELYAMPNGKAAPKLYAFPGAKGGSE